MKVISFIKQYLDFLKVLGNPWFIGSPCLYASRTRCGCLIPIYALFLLWSHGRARLNVLSCFFGFGFVVLIYSWYSHCLLQLIHLLDISNEHISEQEVQILLVGYIRGLSKEVLNVSIKKLNCYSLM